MVFRRGSLPAIHFGTFEFWFIRQKSHFFRRASLPVIPIRNSFFIYVCSNQNNNGKVREFCHENGTKALGYGQIGVVFVAAKKSNAELKKMSDKNVFLKSHVDWNEASEQKCQ